MSDLTSGGWQRTIRRWMGRPSIPWETHAVGERMLVEELQQLRAEGYRIFSDRRLEPGHKDVIDVIVLGPPGVFLFDAVHWSGRIVIESGRLVQESRYRRDRTGEINKLLEAAKRVGQITLTYVHPYLVLTGEAQANGDEFVSKVRVRNLFGTAAFLRTQIRTLSEDDVERLSVLIENNFPHQDEDVEDNRGPRVAGGTAGGQSIARSLITIPHLPGANFRRRPGHEPEQEEYSEPARGETAYGLSRVSGPRTSDGPRRWRPALPPGPRIRGLVPSLVLLAGLLVVAFDPLSIRSALLEPVTDCSILDEDEASRLAGQDLDGNRRLRGGCAFHADDDSGDPLFLVFEGGAADRRAEGATKLVEKRDDCGMLAVAPADARVTSARDSEAARKVPAAACVRAGDSREARLEAASLARRLVLAVRAKSAADA